MNKSQNMHFFINVFNIRSPKYKKCLEKYSHNTNKEYHFENILRM